MKKEPIRYILFDAANTLIHKPLIWDRMEAVFRRHGLQVDGRALRIHHKLISELIEFPDKTSAEFYHQFNSELLFSLGILPGDALLKDIFDSCTYLPWEKFDDTAILSRTGLPMGVLSNFNNGLGGVMNNLFGHLFTDIIVSEERQLRKPDAAFYELAQEAIGLPADQILYIGDSLKLDILPGIRMGWNVLLIDRLEIFTASPLSIPSLERIKNYL
ncbi:HAD family hydrolase [Chitinophaga sp. GCM10012297]|uniref:HAD family hydrolase n=1 Tax=Chitinophaga chungangae TaxID=2821488 RepID=A0ABS3YF15_9BACT|nr:HAD family hydrolase [Chitinophaga chungangae]MBO9153258.1 HAD family hydrolase [Chitinophaga chungangae]